MKLSEKINKKQVELASPLASAVAAARIKPTLRYNDALVLFMP